MDPGRLALEPMPCVLHYSALVADGESQKMEAFELTSPLNLIEEKPKLPMDGASYLGHGMETNPPDFRTASSKQGFSFGYVLALVEMYREMAGK